MVTINLGQVKEMGRRAKSYVRTNRLKTILIILTILWCVYITYLLCITPSWAASNLNDEVGIVPLPLYQDENITLTFIGTDGYSEENSSIITSEYKTRVEIANYVWPGYLQICYMEVLVWNGTSKPYIDDWSFNLTAGDKRGSWSSSHHQISIPEHNALDMIYIQINLLSTNYDNTTYFTPSPLNGMTFNYTVYYSDDEIAEDLGERQIVAGNALQNAILWAIILGMGLWISRQEFDEYTEGTIILTNREKPGEQIGYYSGRIDSLEQERHHLLIEIQILLVILGGVAAYSATQTVLSHFFFSSIILAIPLVFAVIILMMGPEREPVGFLVEADNQELLKLLKKETIRKTKFIQRIKKLIAFGSFMSLEIVIIGMNIDVGNYHALWLGITSMVKIGLILVAISVFAVVIYIAFSKIDVEVN